MRKLLYLLIVFFVIPSMGEATLPELTPKIAHKKLTEIMKAHASNKEMNKTIAERSIKNYLEKLDPTKSYFIKEDIQEWLTPSDALLEQVVEDFHQKKFPVYEDIHQTLVNAIHRRKEIEKEIDLDDLPKSVDPKEFKNMEWVESKQELLERLKRIRALQMEAAAKLDGSFKEKSLQRILKRQDKIEGDMLNTDPNHHQNLVLSNMLKATSAALDSQTAYFTPGEATEFMIMVQQRLLGIGVQLRDDISGFTVTRLLEGGPALREGEMKVNDRIVAVEGEPVVGMDISEAVELIRGPEGTNVTLSVIREMTEGEQKKLESLDIVIPREKVVLTESRYESSYEPFGDGVIAYLRLFSFYQDADSSSVADLKKELENIKKDHKVKGVVLDLRFNSGGMLSQAVAVTGMFITKGVVVSIKDNTGKIQHLRDIDGKTTWDGPLVVLVNRGSASASEIVAQTLKDYGRALIVGDEHTYGKGSFQTFTLNASKDAKVNPEGEYKVTRGRYYTVSGLTPQLTGVASDITIPGVLSKAEIGEQYSKYPLENDFIKDNFDDDLSDIPFSQRDKIRMLYKFDLQPRLNIYTRYTDTLKGNSEQRIANNKNYQALLEELDKEEYSEETQANFGKNDLQLAETYNVMKDLILLLQ